MLLFFFFLLGTEVLFAYGLCYKTNVRDGKHIGPFTPGFSKVKTPALLVTVERLILCRIIFQFNRHAFHGLSFFIFLPGLGCLFLLLGQGGCSDASY